MGISIIIHAGPDKESSTVVVSGNEQHIITNTERSVFNIQDAALKEAVKAYFGQAPNDAFVCSPTPWGDLYSTYGWQQVQTTLAIQSATVVGVTSEPTIIAKQTFQNTSSQPATFNCGLTQDVSTTVQSSWSNTSAVEIGQTISYGISFLGSGGGGQTSFSFSQTWEKAGMVSETVTVGTRSGVTVELEPNQSVVAELTAARGVLTIQIVYQLTLAGMTAVNYGTPYKGHHFWALDINAVMDAGAIPRAITTTETIEVEFYSDAKILLKNPNGDTLGTFTTGAQPGIPVE